MSAAEPSPSPPAAAVVVAAGAGVRMGSGIPKALVPLGARPMLAWCLDALAAAPEVGPVIVVAPPGLEGDTEAAVGRPGRLHAVVGGGPSRAHSVARGLAAVPDGVDRLLVHDAARPLLTAALVARVLAALDGAEGAIAAAPVADTLKRVGEEGMIAGTVDRAGLWAAQTPQAFWADVLRAAVLAATDAELAAATDCAALVEARGGRVRLVDPGAPNLKVTTPADLALAERLIGGRLGEAIA